MSSISENTSSSRLLENSGEFRSNNLKWNTFKLSDQYLVSHPNALSTGDELGKGEFNNSVGSNTDIKMRKQLKKFNKFNANNEYNASNA